MHTTRTLLVVRITYNVQLAATGDRRTDRRKEIWWRGGAPQLPLATTLSSSICVRARSGYISSWQQPLPVPCHSRRAGLRARIIIIVSPLSSARATLPPTPSAARACPNGTIQNVAAWHGTRHGPE